MYQEVLVPLSGSTSDERVIAHAIVMAQLTNAQAHLVKVLDSSTDGSRDRPVDPVEWHVRKLEAEAYLDGVAERFRSNGIKVNEVLLEGQASEHLINYAHNAKAELVVMSGDHDGGGIGALGSELLWRSFVSTLLVRSVHSAHEDVDRLPGEAAAADEPYEVYSGDESPDGDDAYVHEEGHESLHAALTPITVNRWRPRPSRTHVASFSIGRVSVQTYRKSASDSLGTAVEPHETAPVLPAPTTAQGGGLAADSAEPTPTEARLLAADTPSRVHYVSEKRLAEDEEQQQGGPRFRRVMVALDGSKRSECVLSWVRLVAQKHGARVLLAHVVADPELPRITPASQEDLDLARQLLERNRAEAAAYLKDAQARLGVESETRLEVGHRVATKLHDIVASEDIDLVVMSAHGYGGESRWPFGDVATNFIGYGNTALLLVQDMPRSSDARTRGDVTTERWGG